MKTCVMLFVLLLVNVASAQVPYETLICLAPQDGDYENMATVGVYAHIDIGIYHTGVVYDYKLHVECLDCITGQRMNQSYDWRTLTWNNYMPQSISGGFSIAGLNGLYQSKCTLYRKLNTEPVTAYIPVYTKTNTFWADPPWF